MTEQITMQALTWKGIAAVIGIILPIIVLIVWKKNQGRIRLKPAVAGAVVFIIFTQMLETVPKLFLFGDTKISEYVWSHPWAYVTAGCLLAGIFEEIGRYVAFRFFLKDYHDRKDAITYGIGHGGIESVLVLGITGISSIGMALAVNQGTLESITAGMNAGQIRSVEMQITALAGYGAVNMLIEVCERVFAMTLHIALSIVVFRSVKEKKVSYLFIAVLLHAVFDVPAALYQCGVLPILATEALLLLTAAGCAYYARRAYLALDRRNTFYA